MVKLLSIFHVNISYPLGSCAFAIIEVENARTAVVYYKRNCFAKENQKVRYYHAAHHKKKYNGTIIFGILLLFNRLYHQLTSFLATSSAYTAARNLTCLHLINSVP